MDYSGGLSLWDDRDYGIGIFGLSEASPMYYIMANHGDFSEANEMVKALIGLCQKWISVLSQLTNTSSSPLCMSLSMDSSVWK